MTGKTLVHYRVGEQLGHRGMGEVCVADEGGRFSLDDWSTSYLLYHDANQPELWAVPLSEEWKPVLVTGVWFVLPVNWRAP